MNCIAKIHELYNINKELGADLTTEITDLRSELRKLWDESADHGGPKVRAEFIAPCPAEGCRGFLSSQYVCKLCDIPVCSKCMCIKKNNKKKKDNEEDEHKCNPEDVASVEKIKSDSRKCPKCGVNIYRSEGCSIMFCTNCHTGFNYNTLKIFQSNIHNPHYYDYIRSEMDPINR